jgi:FlaA1/EpsC-like NDP-sugar epimerase
MKYIIVNTLFFGIIGSWVGGAIFLSILAIAEAIPHNFIFYLLFSPLMGFIPGSATGFLFIRDYKKQISKFNIISRKFEILLACKNSFIVAVTVVTLLYLSEWEMPKSIENLVGFGLFLLICILSAIFCTVLLSNWNRNKLAKKLSSVIRR